MVYYDRVVNFLSKIQSLHSPLVIELNYIVIYIAYIYSFSSSSFTKM